MPTESRPRRALLAAALLLTAGCAATVPAGPPVAPPSPSLAASAPQPAAAAAAPAPADATVADLSICGRQQPLAADGPVDVAELARRLHGTWELRTRTIQGLTIDTDSHFWFDVAAADGAARGTAMLVDYGNLDVLDPRAWTRACPAHATVSARWRVSIDPQDEGALSLVMDGEYFGSYGDFLDGIEATERATFYRHGDGYFAGRLVSPAGGQGIPDDVWDRIALDDGVLTYVSCEGRYIDRYVKISDATPRVEGRDLEAAWQHRKATGATLEPIPVIKRWAASGPPATDDSRR